MVSIAPAPPPLTDGHRFGGADQGRFLVEKQVGRGGQGLVYRVRDTRLGRLAAAKVCDAKEGPHKQIFLERFERELTLSSRVSHPHVLQVYDCGELATGHPFVLLEWMARGSLVDLLQAARKEGRHLPLPYVHYYATALAAALRAVHAGEIIHRDIKPDNVLIHSDGVAKLTDFGIAKDISAGAPALTEVGSTVGTPWFMAPEQLNGMPGPQSDVFSWGVTVYALITGRPPAQQQVNGFPLGIIFDEAWEAVPRSWRPLLQRATAKRIEDRAQDVGELLAALGPLRDAADSRVVMAPGELPPLPTSAFLVSASPVPLAPEVGTDGLGQTMDLTIGGGGAQQGPSNSSGATRSQTVEETLAATPVPTRSQVPSPHPSTGAHTRPAPPGEPLGPPDPTREASLPGVTAPAPVRRATRGGAELAAGDEAGAAVAAPGGGKRKAGKGGSASMIGGIAAAVLLVAASAVVLTRPPKVDAIAVRNALVGYEAGATVGDWKAASSAASELPATTGSLADGALILATDALLAGRIAEATSTLAPASAAGGKAASRAAILRAAAARLSEPPRYDEAANAYRDGMACSGAGCAEIVGRAALGLAEVCAVAHAAAACKDVLGTFGPRDATMLSALVQGLDGHRGDAMSALGSALALPLAGTPSCAELRSLRWFAADPALLPAVGARVNAAIAAGAGVACGGT